MRRFICKFCGEVLEVEENQDELPCPVCHCYYTRSWGVALNYEKLSKKQKIWAIEKLWDLYGGELQVKTKYAYITRDGELAYKIEIDTGNIVAGHQGWGDMVDELFEPLNYNKRMEEVK